MKKIIVFGAIGNSGKYFIDYCNKNLHDKNYEIIATGRRQTDWFSQFNVSYSPVDITDSYEFEKLPQENVYAIVNFSGVLPAYYAGTDLQRYIDVNITGGINILEYARKNHSDRVLYMQTWAEMQGYWGKEKILSPKLPRKLVYTGDHAFYTISKSMIVDSMKMYHAMYGIKDFVFRLPNIYLYSPEKFYYVNGEKKRISYRYMIDKAKQGLDLELWGNPENGKDIVYVKDFCQMIFNACFANVDGGTYCVGTGIKTSLYEQIQGIIDVFAPTGTFPKIINCPEKESCIDFVMDIENAQKDLGYSPIYTYKKYLEDYKKEEESGRWGI